MATIKARIKALEERNQPPQVIIVCYPGDLRTTAELEAANPGKTVVVLQVKYEDRVIGI